jgi:hypothetical protein
MWTQPTTHLLRKQFSTVLCILALYLVMNPEAASGQTTGVAPVKHINSPFDFAPRSDEKHPLQPVVRVMRGVLDHIDQQVQDYSCTLVKRERLDDELGERQHIFMKVRQQPFSVYMQFLHPHKDREVLYVAGMNDGDLIALDGGWKRKIMAPVSLDPEGMIAMSGQKYPITRVGMRNLCEEYLKTSEEDIKYDESEVQINPNSRIGGRSATLIQVVHPKPRQAFHSHISRIFLDNELQVPLHFDAFLWPAEADGTPPLEESYTYTNLKINQGFTSKDFDKENPEIFKQ